MNQVPNLPRTLFNRRYKLVKVVTTQEELDRFFDNRNPDDWERIDVHTNT